MASADLCSRLQNGALARLRSVPLPSSRAASSLLSVLLAQGFLHSVSRGSPAGPNPAAFRTAPVPQRRLWADLKYDGEAQPVLRHLNVVSKPSKRIRLSPEELLRLVTGRRAQFVPPLGLGEIAIVDCGEAGWCEAREAIRRGLGGELVARAG
ncbi:ribosomal protein S8 [Tilletiopsis washingtonensis]|jgi:ribosomal protein S8|uniref:Ribosomal protein S8 n=1 Tax=Tilletiopsis washingtonensis TaxID=58919 RepID=A0A316Z4G8_9BASI|nr:ribosomal protein S8 [Tilletiopsis washingtonensis]PWN96657.1 ribosomal protein S8 [Tilletiopsis washingtonensis]